MQGKIVLLSMALFCRMLQCPAVSVQAVRRSKEAFKLQEDAQYGSSPFKPKDRVSSCQSLQHKHCLQCSDVR